MCYGYLKVLNLTCCRHSDRKYASKVTQPEGQNRNCNPSMYKPLSKSLKTQPKRVKSVTKKSKKYVLDY